MKKIVLTLSIMFGIGILAAKAQNVPTTPNPSTSPTEQGKDVDPAGPGQKDLEFPPDVVDTTATDTSEIPQVRVDSTRMEDKDSLMKTRDTIRSNWDNSGVPRKKETKKKK